MAIRRAALENVIMSFPGFPDGSAGEESTCDAGDTGNGGLIPGSGRSPGRGNGNPLYCSCLENSMEIGAWWAIVHVAKKSWTD